MNNITEKLQDRLQRLFLTCVKEYDYFYFPHLESTTKTGPRPFDLAKEMVKRVMNMIAETEGQLERDEIRQKILRQEFIAERRLEKKDDEKMEVWDLSPQSLTIAKHIPEGGS